MPAISNDDESSVTTASKASTARRTTSAIAQSMINITGLSPRQKRLQANLILPAAAAATTTSTVTFTNSVKAVARLPQLTDAATVAQASNFLPAQNTPHFYRNATAATLLGTSAAVALPTAAAQKAASAAASAAAAQTTTTTVTTTATATSASASHPTFTTYSPPSIESLVASSAEDLSSFRDVTFDIFDDDDDLFGSPLPFDASENGLWNGRFVPPPPRPPFFVDEPVLTDGVTTCDLCSWAMPTKSTFTFEGTIEKASELGWPLTLIIVSILSALFGAIIMVTVVRCRRKKASNNRNETHVQWWSRNKRPNGSNNNNHLRRSNIYTAHPADSIRGLHQPTLSAASSLTAITAMGSTPNALLPPPATISSLQHSHTEQFFHGHYPHHPHTLHTHSHTHLQLHNSALQQQQQQQQQQPHHHHTLPQDFEYEHEYHQPEELQLHVQHCRENSSSASSATSSPSLITTNSSILPLPLQLQHQPQQHTYQRHQPHYHLQQQQQQSQHQQSHNNNQQQQQHQQQQQQQAQQQQQQQQRDATCHWPNAAMIVAS